MALAVKELGKLSWTVIRSFVAWADKSNKTAYMCEWNIVSWAFKFHKVVRQQNSGAVEDFILPYSALYLRIQKWKNYWNRSTFAKVIVKMKVAPFLWLTVLYTFFVTRLQVRTLDSSKDAVSRNSVLLGVRKLKISIEYLKIPKV